MIWVVLACILVALFLVSLIRVGVRAEYDDRQLTVRLRTGPAALQVYPLKQRKKKEKKPAKQKPQKKQEEPEPDTGEKLSLLWELLPVALRAAGSLPAMAPSAEGTATARVLSPEGSVELLSAGISDNATVSGCGLYGARGVHLQYAVLHADRYAWEYGGRRCTSGSAAAQDERGQVVHSRPMHETTEKRLCSG